MIEMRFKNSMEDLLESACQSIRYRIRREILHESFSAREMKDLQAQILQDEKVKDIINSQHPDGWLGRRFHGYDSHEAGIRLLCEKGLAPQHPTLASALHIVESNVKEIDREMGSVGRVLDEEGFGGTLMIRAAILAHAGLEEKTLVQDQIEKALDGFRAVLKVESIDEVVETFKGRLFFKHGIKWPGIYHLRLLAFTHGWRNQKNRSMVAEAVGKLIKLSPIPNMSVRHKSQLMAPASFGMQEFNPDLTSMNSAQWMMWFQRLELLSRLGIVGALPGLLSQLNSFRRTLDDHGRFAKDVNHDYFKRWGAYTGLMLEKDWRIPQRRIADLTFRSKLILHYAGSL